MVASPVQRADSSDATEQSDYLKRLGDRVRKLRARRGMTRKRLAAESGVSERYLAKLETGEGNISILLLRQLARALNTSVDQVVLDGPEPSVELSHIVEILRRLNTAELQGVRRWMIETHGGPLSLSRRERVALIGLRGAGKSTIGPLLAALLRSPFVELDHEIEGMSGMPLSTLFDLSGQAGFRRLERQALEKMLDRYPRFVVAVGGGLVSNAATYERLLETCFVIWLRAAPVEHMQRVIAQGDMRPMTDNRESMADLQRILRSREPLYEKADLQIVTSEKKPPELAAALAEMIRHSEVGTAGFMQDNS